MPDVRPPEPPTEPALGIASLLDEADAAPHLARRVRQAIARRELSGSAVELSFNAVGAALLEYLRVLMSAFERRRERPRVD